MRAANGGYSPSATPAIAVKHWQSPQKDTVSVEADFDDLSHGVEIGAAVRAEYAFWLAGSTGGVVHGEGSFFVVDNAQQWIGARGGKELLVGVVCLAGVGDANKLELSEVEFREKNNILFKHVRVRGVCEV